MQSPLQPFSKYVAANQQQITVRAAVRPTRLSGYMAAICLPGITCPCLWPTGPHTPPATSYRTTVARYQRSCHTSLILFYAPFTVQVLNSTAASQPFYYVTYAPPRTHNNYKPDQYQKTALDGFVCAQRVERGRIYGGMVCLSASVGVVECTWVLCSVVLLAW